MNRKRQKQLEEVAEKVLSETGCQSYIPIRIEEILKKKGIEVRPFDFGEDISGVLIKEDRKTTIGYNCAFDNWKKPTRKRFTLAHELGHYILNHQRSGAFIDTPKEYFTILYRDQNSSTGEFWQEREANAFAAALLMPKYLLWEELFKIRNNPLKLRGENSDVVEELATTFGVSTQAMAFRLTNLDLVW